MMKSFVMIFLGLVLVLAPLEADGKRLYLENFHQLGRKADVRANYGKDQTENKGEAAATGRTKEDNSALGLEDSQEDNLTYQSHHYFPNGTNPFARQRPAAPKSSLKKPRHLYVWCPPGLGFVKFNVDGSCRGNPSPTGYGGVLRNFGGLIVAMFSSLISLQDSNTVELILNSNQDCP
ncbi:hypothetical protein REPUB_Repub20aG0141400 [Reevesia pubescens]